MRHVFEDRVMTSEVTARRVGIGHNNPPEPIDDPLAMLSKRQLAELLAVDPWTIDRWRNNPDFPAPIWISASTPRWRRKDIEAWIASRHRGGVAPDWRRQTKPSK